MDVKDQIPRQLREAARELASLVRGLPYEILGRKTDSGWSIRETAIQFADAALVQSVRIRRVIAEEHPVLQVVDQDKWTHRLCPPSRSLEASLALMELLHGTVADLLESIDGDDWYRNAYHPARGEVTVSDLAHDLLREAHEIHAKVRAMISQLT